MKAVAVGADCSLPPKKAEDMIVKVVDYLSQEVVLGNGNDVDFSTVLQFQRMLPYERLRFKLAQIFVDITRSDDDIPWNRIYECTGDLEMILEELNIEVEPTIWNLISMMCDVQDLLRLPRDDEEEINEYRKIMKENYVEEKDSFLALKSLVDAYQEGNESDILDRKPFSKDFLHRTFTGWLKSIMEQHLELISVPRTLKKIRKRKASGNKRQQPHLIGLKRIRNKSKIHDDGGCDGYGKKGHHKTTGRIAKTQNFYSFEVFDDYVNGQNQVTEKLRRARNALTTTIEDPLEETRKIAKNANQDLSGGRLLEVKLSATRLEFDQDDLEIDDPEDEESFHVTHQLSDLPAERMQRVLADNGIQLNHNSPNKKKGRIFWSQEQKSAFKEAIHDYGVGNWKEIRDAVEYRKYWSGKSNVQLKDLYRNMLKNQEISHISAT